MTLSLIEFLEKIRDGLEVPTSDMQEFIRNLPNTPDEQAAAFLSHVFHKPLSKQNKVDLTLAMRDSGEILNWDGIDKIIVDKHSTGGVGDKITICLVPLLAALGLGIPTITGRGLGFSGGTVDKLEAIPGLDCNLSPSDLKAFIAEFGFGFGKQTKSIAPADKKLYALRDVTATVPSLTLITASILSKKLAENLGHIIFDVKWGTGAFMSTVEEARDLSNSLVETCNGAGTKATALITNMNQPLGLYSGNLCETWEAVRILKESKDSCSDIADVRELTLALCHHLLISSGLSQSQEESHDKMESALQSGQAYQHFCRVVEKQGGDLNALEKNPSDYETTHGFEIKAKQSGTLSGILTKDLGQALVLAKAGRMQQSDSVLPDTALYHPIKLGDQITAGDTLCVLKTNDDTHKDRFLALLENAFQIGDMNYQPSPLIEEVIT